MCKRAVYLCQPFRKTHAAAAAPNTSIYTTVIHSTFNHMVRNNSTSRLSFERKEPRNMWCGWRMELKRNTRRKDWKRKNDVRRAFQRHSLHLFIWFICVYRKWRDRLKWINVVVWGNFKAKEKRRGEKPKLTVELNEINKAKAEE